MVDVDGYTPQERAAVVVWHLARGDGILTCGVAMLTGLTRQGAWQLMCRLSRVLPIYQDGDGFWQAYAMREIVPN